MDKTLMPPNLVSGLQTTQQIPCLKQGRVNIRETFTSRPDNSLEGNT
jgi:hypothetical protein